MSILGNANYRIGVKHYLPDGSFTEETYVDNFDSLRRTIATTWSKIPHLVAVNGYRVKVTKEGTEEVLSEFTFEPFDNLKLPDHF